MSTTPRRRIAVLAAILATTVAGLALCSPPAGAGTPGTWTSVNVADKLTDPVAAIRRPDGSLGVVYVVHDSATSTDSLVYRRISAGGAVGTRTTIVGGWHGIDTTNLGIMPTASGGIRVGFKGAHSSDPNDYWAFNGTYTAVGNADGTAWTLPQQRLNGRYNGAGTGYTTLADGTPVSATVFNNEINWRVGTAYDTSNPPDHVFTLTGFGAEATLVRQGSEVSVAWHQTFSNTAANDGYWVKPLYPTFGAAIHAPGSTYVESWSDHSALVARKDGANYLAYCRGASTCEQIKVWRVGSSTAVSVPASAGARDVALATDQLGHLWVSWIDTSYRVKAVRTSTTGLTFGPVRDVGTANVTPGYGVFGLTTLATNSHLDVLADNSERIEHTQVLPGLTLAASPTSWPHTGSKTVVFTVRDAGAIVANAHVTAGTKGCYTNTYGKCSISFPAMTAKYFYAYASHGGYYRGAVKLHAY